MVKIGTGIRFQMPAIVHIKDFFILENSPSSYLIVYRVTVDYIKKFHPVCIKFIFGDA